MLRLVSGHTAASCRARLARRERWQVTCVGAVLTGRVGAEAQADRQLILTVRRPHFVTSLHPGS
jgi:hypothetical protein